MADKVYKISGQFDASSIIKGFKEIRSEMSKVGVSPDMFKGLDKDLEKLTKLSETFKEMREKGFSNTREVEKYNQILSQMGDVINHTNKEFTKLNQSSNFKVNAKGIENLTKQMLQASDSVDNMRDSIQNIVKKSSNFSLKKVRDELAEAVEEGRELSQIIEKAWNDQRTKGFESVQKQLNAKNADGSVNKGLLAAITGEMQSSQIKLNTQLDPKHIDDYKAALAELMLTGKSVKETFNDLGVELSEEEQKYASSAKFVEDYQKDLQALGKQAAQGKVANIGSFVSQLNKATSIGGYDINGRFQLTGTDGNAIRNYDTAVVQLTTSVKELNDAQEEATKQGIELQNKWENSANEQIDTFNKRTAFEKEEIQTTYANIQAQGRLDDSFAALQNRLKQLLSLGSAYRMFRNVIQQTYNDVQDLDKAFGEIAMVTNYTVQDLWSQYDNYAAMANRLGQQTVSVIQASGLFYQQGKLNPQI